MNKIRIAIIGLGYWGPNILRNLLNIPRVKVLYGCDLDKKNLQAIHHLYPSISLTNTAESVFHDKNVDAIVIATPPETHYSLARKSLLSGKHILVEKPITTSSADAVKLKNIAKKHKLTLMVGHTFVYSEAVKSLKKMLSQQLLGELFYFDSTRINLGRIQEKNNVIWDLAVHDFSILDHLLEMNPSRLHVAGSSHIGKNNIEDAHIFLQYQNNISAHIHAGWLSPIKIRTIIIGASKKMIVYNDIEQSEKIKIYNKSISLNRNNITPFKPAYRSGDILIPQLAQEEALRNELSHFVDCVITNKNPLTGPDEGIRVVKLLEACDRSLLDHSTILMQDMF